MWLTRNTIAGRRVRCFDFATYGRHFGLCSRLMPWGDAVFHGINARYNPGGSAGFLSHSLPPPSSFPLLHLKVFQGFRFPSPPPQGFSRFPILPKPTDSKRWYAVWSKRNRPLVGAVSGWFLAPVPFGPPAAALEVMPLETGPWYPCVFERIFEPGSVLMRCVVISMLCTFDNVLISMHRPAWSVHPSRLLGVSLFDAPVPPPRDFKRPPPPSLRARRAPAVALNATLSDAMSAAFRAARRTSVRRLQPY